MRLSRCLAAAAAAAELQLRRQRSHARTSPRCTLRPKGARSTRPGCHRSTTVQPSYLALQLRNPCRSCEVASHRPAHNEATNLAERTATRATSDDSSIFTCARSARIRKSSAGAARKCVLFVSQTQHTYAFSATGACIIRCAASGPGAVGSRASVVAGPPIGPAPPADIISRAVWCRINTMSMSAIVSVNSHTHRQRASEFRLNKPHGLATR